MNICRWPSSLSIVAGLALLASLSPVQAASNPARKFIVYPQTGDTTSQAIAAGATKVQNLGSYWVVEADAAQQATLKAQFGDRIQPADYLNVIELAAGALDTRAAAANAGAAPLAVAPAATTGTQTQLRLLQFIGPVLPEWLTQVKQAGKVTILSYMPNNAYLVRVDAAANLKLAALLQPKGPIQYLGDFLPQYKIGRSLSVLSSNTVTIRLAVADGGPDTAASRQAIQSMTVAQVAQPVQVLKQTRLEITVRSADVAAISQLPDVLWMEKVQPRTRFDELQAIQVATDDAGVAPDRYFNFLALKQIDPNWSFPVLDIADSGLDEPNPVWGYDTWHPSFWSSAFLVSPSGQCGTIGFIYQRWLYNGGIDTVGHGTLVASVASGIDAQPDELLHCITQTITIGAETNITERFVTNGFEFVCNDPVRCPTTECCLTGGTIIRIVETNIVAVTNCTVNVDDPPWPMQLPRRLFGTYQYGLGISPYAFFGASLGGAEEGFAGPENHGLQVYLRTARISNNSWGELLVTDVGTNGNDGAYGAFGQAYDALTRDAVPSGSTNPPTPGLHPVNQELLYVFAGGNANGIDGGAGGYGDVLVTPPATAKNVLTVGACDSSNQLATFTSFGPTEDGRFKPEIMAPGVDIVGAKSQATYTHPECGGCNPVNPSPPACTEGFTLYQMESQLYGDGPEEVTLHSGTSFSAPAVAGAAQLLWAWYQNRLQQLPPSPAMLKAYICNAAQYLNIVNPLTGVTDRLPSPAQGMGRLDLARMFDGVPRVLRDETTQRAIDSPLLTTNPVPQQIFFTRTGQSYEFDGTIYDATKPFRVTLTWSDVPGNPAAFKQLVNDLDLEVTVNGTVYRGNVFDRQFSTVDANRPFDDINNMESVFLPVGATGTWSIIVRAKNIADAASPNSDPNPNQDFALVVYNAQNAAASDVPVIGTPNDTCQNATALTVFPTNFTVTLTKTLFKNNHPSPSASRGGVEAFWKLTQPTIGTSFTINTFGSDFDTVLSVWRGNWCGALVEEVSNNNAEEGNFQSLVSFTANGDDDYYIVVEPHNGGFGGNLILDVQAVLPSVPLVPATVNFGDLILGGTSTVQSVTVQNNTPGPLLISGVAITGDNPSDFLLYSDDCTGTTLVPGGSCIMYLKFVPTAVGARTAQLRVTDDATGSPRYATLTGNALPPSPLVCLNRSGITTFSNQTVGVASSPLSLVLTNCGSAPLTITNIVFTGAGSNDFSATGSCLGTPIAPGATCTINLVFKPTATGTRQAVLQIDSNALDSPATLTVRGTGFIPIPSVCLSRTVANFGSVNAGAVSAPVSVVVTNCGSAPLAITEVQLQGANPGDFQIVSESCTGGLIATGSTCSISLRFAPTTGGNRSATLSINASDADAPHTVSLTGGGIASLPDALIDKSDNLKKMIGAAIINSTGSGQTVGLRGKPGKPKRFYVAVRNSGSVSDVFKISGDGNGGGFQVRYFLGATGGTEVTSAILAGTLSSSTLAAGAVTGDATMIRVEITPDATVRDAERTVLIRFASALEPGKQDAVGARVFVK